MKVTRIREPGGKQWQYDIDGLVQERRNSIAAVTYFLH